MAKRARSGDYKHPGPQMETEELRKEIRDLKNEMKKKDKGETELKGYDVDMSSFPASVSTTLTDNGDSVLLNPIQGGSDYFRILGKKANIQSLRIRGHLHGADTQSSTFVRLVLVQCKQTEASIPKFDSVFGGVTTGGTALTTGILSNVQLANTKRYKVLMDKVWPLPPSFNNASTPTATVSEGHNIDQFIFFKNGLSYESDQAAATAVSISNIKANALVLYARATTTGANISNMQCRVRFQE